MDLARSSDPGLLSPAETALLVDLYELTMSASYLARGINDDAIFELFTRRLPPRSDRGVPGLPRGLSLHRGHRCDPRGDRDVRE